MRLLSEKELMQREVLAAMEDIRLSMRLYVDFDPALWENLDPDEELRRLDRATERFRAIIRSKKRHGAT